MIFYDRLPTAVYGWSDKLGLDVVLHFNVNPSVSSRIKAVDLVLTEELKGLRQKKRHICHFKFVLTAGQSQFVSISTELNNH